jgi:CRP-like cAMP-binding protein
MSADDPTAPTLAATTRQLAEQLATVPLFARCHPGDLRVVARRCRVREVPADTLLIRAGELGDELFVLISGSAERRLPGYHVRTFGPGDYFGELALLDPAPRSLDVVTTSDCVVGVLSRANFLLVLDAVPGVWPQLLAFLAHRLREADLREEHEALPGGNDPPRVRSGVATSEKNAADHQRNDGVGAEDGEADPE